MYIWDKKIVKKIEKDNLVEVLFSNDDKETYTKKSFDVIQTKKKTDATELEWLWSQAIIVDIIIALWQVDLVKKATESKTAGQLVGEVDKVQLKILEVIMEYWATIWVTTKSLTAVDNLYNVIIKKVTDSLQFSIDKATLKPFWVNYQDQVSLLDIDKILKK